MGSCTLVPPLLGRALVNKVFFLFLFFVIENLQSVLHDTISKIDN